MIRRLIENKEKIFLHGLLILYAVVTFIIASYHECWEDEVQAWLIARDLNVIDVIKQMKYEGHSCLWHLILMPFAKAGLPFETMKIVSWIFCVAAVYLILMKAPFGKIIKILFCFSPGMLYFFPSISRCYSLIPFLVTIICILYKDKEKHSYAYATAIALLVNTHVLMAVMAMLLGIDFWGEKLILKRKELTKEEKTRLWKSAWIAVFGGIVLVLQVLPGMENCTLVSKVEISNIEKIRNGLNSFAIFLYNYNSISGWNYFGTAGIECVVILLIMASIYNKKQAKIFWIQVLYFFAVNIYIWFFIRQRVYLIEFPFLFWCWTCHYEDNPEKIFKKIPVTIYIDLAVSIFLIVSMYNYNAVKSDIYGQYTCGYEIAEVIENNMPKGSVFIVTEPSQLAIPAIGILDSNDYKFYNPNVNEYFTYVTWSDEFYNEVKNKEIKAAAERLKSQGVQNIYVLNFVFGEEDRFKKESDMYEKVYIREEENEEMENHNFAIYRVK